MNELIIDKEMATVQDYLKNDKWMKRINGVFSSLDVNKDGYLSAEDWTLIVDNLEKTSSYRPEAIAKAREKMLELTTAMGLTKGVKADKKKFPELLAAFCLAEAGKMKRGEMTSLEKADSAMFDLIDKNGDGHVTFEEYKFLMDASNLGEEAAKGAFNLLDKNKNGKLERDEFVSSNLRFWCTLDDPSTKGMYGDKFE